MTNLVYIAYKGPDGRVVEPFSNALVLDPKLVAVAAFAAGLKQWRVAMVMVAGTGTANALTALSINDTLGEIWLENVKIVSYPPAFWKVFLHFPVTTNLYAVAQPTFKWAGINSRSSASIATQDLDNVIEEINPGRTAISNFASIAMKILFIALIEK